MVDVFSRHDILSGYQAAKYDSFVSHSDYATLEAQLAEVREKAKQAAATELDALQRDRDESARAWRKYGDDMHQRAMTAEARLSALETTPPAPKVTGVRPLDDWHEDYGHVVWWAWEDGEWLGEPSYIGSPLCDDWPGYHTHWSPHPPFPAALEKP